MIDCEGLRLAVLNPRLIENSGIRTLREGCLSIGKISATVKRSEKVFLSYQEIDGRQVEREFTGLVARCIQHETDHCNGILFIDHLSPVVRQMVTKRFLKRKATTGSTLERLRIMTCPDKFQYLRDST